ncbi:adhesion G-protein coupled receptor D1-like [Antedon mediterranea]|uniref:adhesion G-protein coupled receptor D1-like n=1 Tax=Antedon mediterranea TaxID=105859 RepID=UPI003AF6429A
MSSLCWMLIYTSDLYFKVRNPFSDHDLKLKYYRVIGWSFPAIFIGILMGVSGQDYANEKCWINARGSRSIVLIIPISFTLLVNMIMLMSILGVAYKKKKSLLDNSNAKERIRIIKDVGLKGVFLFPLVGATWISAVLMFSMCSAFVNYIHVILNSSLGLMIWLTQFRLSSEVSKAWIKHARHTSVAPLSQNGTETMMTKWGNVE